MRRALSPRYAGQPLSGLTVHRVLPRYTVRPPVPHPRRAVCCINWIRRHGTFPICRLRGKLHGPFSYVAGDTASYVWRCFDKTAPDHAERWIQGAGKEIQARDPLRLHRHNICTVRYFILHWLGPPVGDPTAIYAPPLRYKREALAIDSRTHSGLSTKLSQTLSRLRKHKQYNTQ